MSFQKFEKSAKYLDDLLGKQRVASDRVGLGFKQESKGKNLNQEDMVPSKESGESSIKEEKKETYIKDNVNTKPIRKPNASRY